MARYQQIRTDWRGRPRTGRGEQAERPQDIPRRGWKEVFWRVKDEIAKDNLSIVAAGVAFYGLFAIFPAITAFVTLYGLVTILRRSSSSLRRCGI